MVRAQKGGKAMRLKELQNEKRLLGKELYPMASPIRHAYSNFPEGKSVEDGYSSMESLKPVEYSSLRAGGRIKSSSKLALEMRRGSGSSIFSNN